MATKTLTWPAAVEAICEEMQRFAACRANGFGLEHAADAVGISLTTAIRYQRTIDRLMADLNTATAPAATGTARTSTEKGISQ